MELKEIVTLYRRWIWLLFAGVALGVSSGFLASKIQTPVYEASTKILITRSRQEGSADMLSLNEQEIVLTYQQLLKSRPILDEVKSRLDVNLDPDNVKVDVILNTQIIQIRVQDSNPERAAAIANIMVKILMDHNDTLYAGRYDSYEGSLHSQITEIQTQIDKLQGQITQINEAVAKEQLALVNQQITQIRDEVMSLESDIADFPALLSVVDRARLAEKQTQLGQLRSLLYIYQQIQSNLTFIGQPVQGETPYGDPRRTSIQATLNLYQQLYLDLLNNLAATQLARIQSTPLISQIETAISPERPLRPIPLLYTALAGIVGLFIMAIAILLINYFEDTFTSTQKVEALLGVPVIGEISEVHPARKAGRLGSVNELSSLLFNAFGILRINVSRLVAQKSLKTILITSPGLGDGKSTIVVNLAKAFAQSGQKVVVLDADFYHPTLHSQFGLDKQRGLSDILVKNLDWQDVALDVDGITVITSGVHASATGISFESDRMIHLLDQLRKEGNVVIIDSPPLFVVDTQILASKVEGVVLVVRQGSAVDTLSRAMLNQLNLIGANVLGIVLNRVSRAKTGGYTEFYRSIPEQTLDERIESLEVSPSEVR